MSSNANWKTVWSMATGLGIAIAAQCGPAWCQAPAAMPYPPPARVPVLRGTVPPVTPVVLPYGTAVRVDPVSPAVLYEERPDISRSLQHHVKVGVGPGS